MEPRLELAKKIGADFCINPLKVDIYKELNEWTNGRGITVVIDAVGKEEILKKSTKIVCNGGRILIVGVPPRTAEIKTLPILLKELDIIGSRLANNFLLPIAILKNKKLILNKLISHIFPFEEIEKAFSLAMSCDPLLMKVIVTIPFYKS